MHLRFGLGLAAVVLFAGPVMAQSSLGIGGGEQPVLPGNGFFGNFLAWVGTEQRAFYRSMTEALKDMREDGSAVWLLIGLSFLYGVLHAAGPGHGKVVISSYMLANETALRRGILLSFASSALQAITAIVVVGAGFLVLRGTAVSMTDASSWLETASYVLIIAVGIWLFWRKARSALLNSTLQTGNSVNAQHHPEQHHDHEHHHHHNHGSGEVCSSCGHNHMPEPDQLTGKFDLRVAFGAVFAVGLRPCTGAVIVLSFALLNGLYLGGIASVFAMALGTAFTVSTLAVMAVTAKNVAMRFSGSVAMSSRLQTGIELFGASLLIVLGVIMLAGSIAV